MTAVWCKLYHFHGDEGNVGIVRIDTDGFVAEPSTEISVALGTSPTNLDLYPFGTDMPVADSSSQIDGDALVSTLPSTGLE